MQIETRSREPFDASALTVGIVRARFNEALTEALLESAKRALKTYGVKEERITVLTVAGAMELPYALQQLAKTGGCDALVALGAVIRGETPHFDYVCKTAQEGVLRVSLDHHIPIGFGIMTVENEAQAEARTELGADAAVAALELAYLKGSR